MEKPASPLIRENHNHSVAADFKDYPLDRNRIPIRNERFIHVHESGYPIVCWNDIEILFHEVPEGFSGRAVPYGQVGMILHTINTRPFESCAIGTGRVTLLFYVTGFILFVISYALCRLLKRMSSTESLEIGVGIAFGGLLILLICFHDLVPDLTVDLFIDNSYSKDVEVVINASDSIVVYANTYRRLSMPLGWIDVEARYKDGEGIEKSRVLLSAPQRSGRLIYNVGAHNEYTLTIVEYHPPSLWRH